MAESNVKPLRTPEPTPVPAMGCSYQFPLTESGISIVFQTHFDATSDRRDIDEVLDRMQGAAERQKAKLELPKWRHDLLVDIKKLELAEREYVSNEAKFSAVAASRNRREGANEMTRNQKDLLENGQKNIKQLLENVEWRKQEIARREAVVAGEDAYASGT